MAPKGTYNPHASWSDNSDIVECCYLIWIGHGLPVTGTTDIDLHILCVELLGV